MATTRSETPEGFIVAGAVLTRAGQFDYLRREIGLDGDPNELVTIERTMETLQHPDTLASIRRAPITNDHPQDGVNPQNWGEVVDGMVVGEPTIMGNAIVSDVLVASEQARRDLEEGKVELSVGYDFEVNPTQTQTVGPLMVNHVALVEKGRAGPAVRVLDRKPTSTIDANEPTADEPDEGAQVTEEDINAIADAAAEKAADAAYAKYMGEMGDAKGGDGSGGDAGKHMSRDAMKSMMKEAAANATAEAMKEHAAAQASATDAAEAKKRAEDAAAKLQDTVRAEERQRYSILTDAMPLIDDEAKVSELMDADAKTILVAALGDTVPDADKRSVDYLQGALAVAKAEAKRAADFQPNGLPRGVSAWDGNQSHSANDARAAAVDEFTDAQTKLYTEAGGV